MSIRLWNQFSRSCSNPLDHNRSPIVAPTYSTTPVVRIGQYPRDHPLHPSFNSSSTGPRVTRRVQSAKTPQMA